MGRKRAGRSARTRVGGAKKKRKKRGKENKCVEVKREVRGGAKIDKRVGRGVKIRRGGDAKERKKERDGNVRIREKGKTNKEKKS